MANSIKDMLQSVDWKKALSSKDARNALVGSALGGLVLGGTGLLAERDPEESKAAPVRDALMGMLLGGVAGYGIPKGISLFLDSGGLAPDNDVLRHSYGKHALVGGGMGVGAAGLAAWRTLHNVARGMRPDDAARAKGFENAKDAFRLAQSGGQVGPSDLERLRRGVYAHHTDAVAAYDFLDNLRDQRALAARRGDAAAVAKYEAAIRDFKDMRLKATRGYSRFADLLDQVGRQGLKEKTGLLDRLLFATRPGASNPQAGLIRRMLSGGRRAVGDFVANPRNYNGGSLYFGRGPRLPIAGNAGLRMLRRAGRWGAAGALGAVLLHKLVGPSASDNFKK